VYSPACFWKLHSRISLQNTDFPSPVYGPPPPLLGDSAEPGKCLQDKRKFHQESVIDFFIHVMTFSSCRRLNVHRKSGYTRFLYPLANVRPLTTMSRRGNWCMLGRIKRRESFFYHVPSRFFMALSWVRDVRCVTWKRRMTHCFIDFQWQCPVDILGWQPYTAILPLCQLFV
jgi:hypothetical protein